MPAHVFISYASEDRERAHWWCRALEGDGQVCWMAPRDIAPGADWAAQIIDGIEAARAVLLLLTGPANRSSQVRREVERAVHKQVPVIALRLDSEPLSKSLEYFLSAQHWVAAQDHRPEQLLTVVLRALRGLAGGPVVASPAVPAQPPVTWPDALLTRLTAELAQRVGPVAPALVAHAARRARTAQELIALLSDEVDDPQARASFIGAAGSLV